MQNKKTINPYIKFFELEKKYNLFNLKYNDVFYWQIVRYEFYTKIITRDSIIINQSPKKNIIKTIVNTLFETIKQKIKIKFLHDTDIIRLRPCITVDRNSIPSDHQYDFTPIPSDIKVADVYTLGNYSEIHKCIELDTAIPEFALFPWKIKTRLFGDNKFPSEHISILQEFLDELNSIYETDFDINDYIYRIKCAVKSHNLYFKYYRILFRVINPKAIMVYPHYDEHMFSAIHAARETGISSIEIQHGRINSHGAYYYSDTSESGKYMPDYLFTFGNWWTEQINMPKPTKVISTGNPYLEYQLKIYKNKNKIKTKIIAFFSGPHTGVELSKFAVTNFFELKKFGYSVIYKLHPNECDVWKREYPWLKEQDGFKVISDKSISAYEIIAESDAIIAINSTILFEATAYPNKKIAVLNKGNTDAMQILIEHGAAKKINSISELFELLEDKVCCEFNQELWKNNSVENTVNELRKIIGK